LSGWSSTATRASCLLHRRGPPHMVQISAATWRPLEARCRRPSRRWCRRRPTAGTSGWRRP